MEKVDAMKEMKKKESNIHVDQMTVYPNWLNWL
jgi:hypothetical protein